MVQVPPYSGPQADEVLEGADGQLFLGRGAHNVLDYVSGALAPPEASYRFFEENVLQRRAFCDARRPRYLHVIHPDKQSVLTEAFPRRPVLCLGTIYLERCARAAPSILYPRALLRDSLATVERPLFLRTDTHLSDDGNLLVAAAVLRALGEDATAARMDSLRPDIVDIREHVGDLGSKLQPPRGMSETYLARRHYPRLYSNRLTGNDGIVDLWLSARADGPRVLILGDSFGRDLARMLSAACREVVFLRTPFFHPEMAEQIDPDCVVTQNVERYLNVVRPDADRPAFHMYPYMKPVLPTPDPQFAEAFSAILSYPRKPYQAFMRALGQASPS